jgi:hypothetical protein
VAGDGESSTGFECPIGNAIIAGDVKKPERTVLIDGDHTTVKKFACVTAPVITWESCQREPEEGDGRGGLAEHVAEEYASEVVDPAQAVVEGDDSVGLPQNELPAIIGLFV